MLGSAKVKPYSDKKRFSEAALKKQRGRGKVKCSERTLLAHGGCVLFWLIGVKEISIRSQIK